MKSLKTPFNIAFWTFLILFLFSCSGSHKPDKEGYFSEEKFVDSLHAGVKGKTKVEFEKFRHTGNGDVFVSINFYKSEKKWVKGEKTDVDIWRLTNSFKFDKDGISDMDVQIGDFNNDGFNDITYQSAIAGRGGNIVMTLFVYNPGNKDFIHIKNSESYPNLTYNAKLDCINSLILTGSTTTVFLKIKKDSLQEFARVDVSDKIIVEEKDSTGKFKIIEEKPFKGNDEDFYNAFKNYKPLEY
ncbi:XAC2610-related protein [Chryseobacterium indologenes]|uniref:XAC2610-related protein n=1 Tax=Chryseobacterium indologenes TaxID=253 RepID=UPI0009A16F8F|nr:hypothetical protein [Chryseobacterium indologenes]